MVKGRRVATDVLTVGSLAAATKMAGAVKVAVTAHYFGVSRELDAYLGAFLVPSFLSDVLSGSIAAALVPAFLRIRGEHGQERAVCLYQHVLTGSIAMLGLVAMITGVICLVVSSRVTEWIPAMLLVMLPILPTTAATLTWRAVLNAEGNFAAAAGTPLVTPLVSTVLLLMFGSTKGPLVLALGTTTGALLELLVLAWAIKNAGYPIALRWNGLTTDVRAVVQQYGPVVGGSIILGSTTFLSQTFALLLGPGALTVLSYGTKLTSVLLAVGPTALGTVLLPYLSRLAAQRDWEMLRSAVRRSAGLIAATTIPLTLLLMLVSEPFVRAYLQRGAFSAESTAAVAHVQRFSLMQIPIAVTLALVMRLTASLSANQIFIKVACAGLATNVVSNFVLMRQLGVAGIALTDTLTNFVTLAGLSFSLWKIRTEERFSATSVTAP